MIIANDKKAIYFIKGVIIWKNYVLMVFCGFMLNACATAYYSTESDPQAVFDKTQPLTIFINQPTTITDKKFGLLLGDLMVENGFNIVNFNMESQETPCFITFSMNTTSNQRTESYTTYHTSTTYISGIFTGNTYNPGTTITTTTPITNVYTDTIIRKNIGISIFCETENQESSQVWYGFVSANVDDYKNYEKNIMQNLIDLIGKDFKGS